MSNLEQRVPTLNTCLSLLARGIMMNTIFCWVRDDDGIFWHVLGFSASSHQCIPGDGMVSWGRLSGCVSTLPFQNFS